MYNTPQKLAAEFLGTFAIVLLGSGAACAEWFSHETGTALRFHPALAAGVGIAVLYTALGHISGGHFNPAVTVAYWLTRRMNTLDVVGYWLAQLIGAVAAAFLLKGLLPADEAWRSVALGTPQLARDFPHLSAMILEGVLTFLLVLTFFATTSDEENPSRSVAGFAIGLVFMVGVMVAGPFTGGALNPARAFGPALAATHWANWAIFWVGPLAGGFVAGLLYDSLYLKKSI